MINLKVLQYFKHGYFTFDVTEAGKLANPEGIHYELLQVLSQYLKFSYEIIVTPKDTMWGSKLNNGTWTGVIGMLEKRKGDMFIGLPASWQSLEVVDFSHNFQITDSTFAIPKSGLASKSFFYFSPFQISVWIGIILAVFLYGIFLWLMKRYVEKPRLLQQRKEVYRSMEMFFRNYNIHRKNAYSQSSTRLFLAVGILGLTVFRFSYVNIFPSFLMAPAKNIQISTFDQLAKACVKNQAGAAVLDRSFVQRIIGTTDIQYLKDIGRNIRDGPGTVIRIITDIPKTVEKGYAFIFPRFSLENFLRGKENIYMSPDMAWEFRLCVAFKKNFCCKKRFDYIFRRISESGIFDQIMKYDKFRKDLKAVREENGDEETIRSISTSDLIDLFWISGSFLVIAVIVFAIEIGFGKKPNARISKIKRKV